MHTMIIPTEPMLREAAVTTLSETDKPVWKPSPSHGSSVSLTDTYVGSSVFDAGFDTDNDDDESSTNDDSVVEEIQGPLVEASCAPSTLKRSPSSILKTSSASASTSSESDSDSSSKRVGFDSVRIRSYQQTMRDNPAVSYGPPIQLDWEYEEHDGIDIDIFESERVFSRRRTLNQLVMNYYQRKSVLSRSYGFTDEEMSKAKKSANKTKFKRAVTNTLLPMMKVEDVIQSAGRKAKRIIGKAGK